MIERSYPRGRLGADDDGELQMRLAVDANTRTVILDFGKPVAWIGMAASDARRIAAGLIEKATELEAL